MEKKKEKKTESIQISTVNSSLAFFFGEARPACFQLLPLPQQLLSDQGSLGHRYCDPCNQQPDDNCHRSILSQF